MFYRNSLHGMYWVICMIFFHILNIFFLSFRTSDTFVSGMQWSPRLHSQRHSDPPMSNHIDDDDDDEQQKSATNFTINEQILFNATLYSNELSHNLTASEMAGDNEKIKR